jgi:hypothetical protein
MKNKKLDWINMPNDISEYQGFVYLITNLSSGKKYIGKKFFKFMKSRKPLKGRINKRRYTIESDWKDYYGSDRKLLEDVEKLGKMNFKREVLVLCKNKFECAYHEARLQFEHNVLFDNLYYNEIINCRIRKVK